MRMMLLIAVISALPLAAAVHAFPASDGQKRDMPSVSPHAPGGAKGASQGMVGVVQEIALAGYKNVKVGEAFGKYRYFKKKAWSETKGGGGTFYVDFVGLSPPGWLDFDARKKGISSRGIEVKFVIYSNGSYGVGMISRIEVTTDGKTYRYPLADTKGIMDAIYANEKINL